MQTSTENFHDIRGLKYHVRTWGNPADRPLFLLHGWMDVSASFQFLVDALQQNYYCIAPDWQGFGMSEGRQDYWFPDYLADFAAIANIYCPEQPFDLVGHSMGGNIACLYAGVEPGRVRRLISLEGFGMPPINASVAPKRYKKWLDQLNDQPSTRPYADFAELAARLQKNNNRLDDEKAAFLARYWGHEVDGKVVLRADPRHKMANPVLYRVEEAMACWRAVTAPTLWVLADGTNLLQWVVSEDFESRKQCFNDFSFETVADAGHMLHHDQPEAIAELIENFIR